MLIAQQCFQKCKRLGVILFVGFLRQINNGVTIRKKQTSIYLVTIHNCLTLTVHMSNTPSEPTNTEKPHGDKLKVAPEGRASFLQLMKRILRYDANALFQSTMLREMPCRKEKVVRYTYFTQTVLQLIT